MRPEPGLTGDLDEFRLIRPLGRGAMGEVFLANDAVLARQVAIKLLTRTDDAGRERFLTEARAVARLNHPNVVTIYRVGTSASGCAYIAQELIRGTSLDQLPRPVPWRTLCEVGIGIARGLDAAHRAGILHRDVKPANVMIDERRTVRLLDFGIAKLSLRPQPTDYVAPRPSRPHASVAETADFPSDAPSEEPARSGPRVGILVAPPRQPDPELTGPAGLIGTPRYASPEVWRGEGATERSDLYALGALLYELAAGVPPFPQTDLESLAAAVAAGAARPIEELAELPRDLAALITRCLAVDPAERPTSAAELAHALELVAVNAPVAPEGNPYRGLAAFEAAQRGLFFGRGPDIRAVLERLRVEALLAIVGDSGIGKSSLCHAGVGPEVVAVGLGDQRRWRTVTAMPGRTPWRRLCEALDVAHEHAPAEVARSLAQPPEGPGTLIVLDQAEELVTVGDPLEARRVAELLAAVAGGVPGLKALLVVRGDFLTRVASLPHLGDHVARGVHLLRVLGRDDLREAVVGPARARRVRFESDAMVDELVDAVATNPGALPLLQFALAALWDARDAERGVITSAALAHLGGVEGALAGRADGVLFGLAAEERAAACNVLLRLVTPSRTRAIREHAELGADEPVVARAIELLVKGRLVVARDSMTGAPSYELAHEALIRSWGTLRDLLDAELGQHAVRNRLASATAEWRRLGGRDDLLWTPRQVAELRELRDLNPAELEFVGASRRRARRRVLTRGAAIAAVLALALGSIAFARLAAGRERARQVDTRIAAATSYLADAERLSVASTDARRAAFEEFDRDGDGEPGWRRSRKLAADAAARFRDATVELEAAMSIDAAAVRAPMADVLVASARFARAERDAARFAELVRRLDAFDPARASTLHAPSTLAIELDRPGWIAIHGLPRATTISTIAGGFDAEPVAVHAGATFTRSLDAGSYVVVLTMPDGHVVRDPVTLEIGERLVRRLAIPPPRDGMVFVAAGRFRLGSSTDDSFRTAFLFAQPEREATLLAFWIARTEVTYGDWLRYLRAIDPSDAEQRRPTLARTEGTVALEPMPDGSYELVLKPATAEQPLRAREGRDLVYAARTRRQRVRWERLPISGVSYDDGVAYAAWLDRSGTLPGARMCTNLEWERAARGADGRTYPHGEHLRPEDANFDETYDRESGAFGPDEVGARPRSDSPYGVADMVGNVWEFTRARSGKLWAKGGSFYHDRASAIAANNWPTEPGMRNAKFGLRICASAAPAR